MRDVTFKPQITSKSKKLSSGLKPLKERLKGLLEKKENFVNSEKLKQQEDATSHCPFKPNLTMSADRNAQILSQNRTSEVIRFNEWKKTKNDKRRKELEDLEMSDVTHAPMLARKSLQIQQQLVESGRIQVDPLTKQTITTKHVSTIVKGGVGDRTDPGHSEETFSPNITSAGSGYVQNTGAFDRLYNMGVEKAKKKHEAIVSKIE